MYINTQQEHSKNLRLNIIEKEKKKRLEIFNEEKKKYNLSMICEKRIVKSFMTLKHQLFVTMSDGSIPSFTKIISKLTIKSLGCHNYEGHSKLKPNCEYLRVLIQVRQVITKYMASVYYYNALHKNKKDKLIEMRFAKVLDSIQP